MRSGCRRAPGAGGANGGCRRPAHRVQAKSAETVAYVLRAYVGIISRPGVDDVGPFRVDVWDGGGIIETLAKVLEPAGGARRLRAAVKERGRYQITLRCEIRIVATHQPAAD